jgi:uncharacterized protein YjbI with pentapeptide repeats
MREFICRKVTRWSWLLKFNWNEAKAGFLGKTLWDWGQLLIIPILLGCFVSGVAWWFNHQENMTTREIEEKRISSQQTIEANRTEEQNLQIYFDNMTNLLLRPDENLINTRNDSELSIIARTWTLSTLKTITNGERKALVVRFLFEAKLIDTLNTKVKLDGANLNGVNLSGIVLSYADPNKANPSRVNLSGVILSDANLIGVDLSVADLNNANLNHANLSSANLGRADLGDATLASAIITNTFLADAVLSGTILIKANLTGANLTGANLTGADLTGADLTGADLTGAIITTPQLVQAKSLENAVMPDGKKFDPTIHLIPTPTP